MEIIKYRFRASFWRKSQILQVKVKWTGLHFPSAKRCEMVEWRDASREESEDFLSLLTMERK